MRTPEDFERAAQQSIEDFEAAREQFRTVDGPRTKPRPETVPVRDVQVVILAVAAGLVGGTLAARVNWRLGGLGGMVAFLVAGINANAHLPEPPKR